MDFGVLNKPTTAAGDISTAPPALAVSDPFDPAPLRDLFDRFDSSIGQMEAEAAAVKVTDDASHTNAVEMVGEAKALAKAVTDKHGEAKAPYLRVAQALDGFKKPLVDRLAAIQRTLENAMREYMVEQQRKRQEAERKAREEAARIQADMEAEAKAAGMDKPPPVVVPVVEPETRTKTESATAGLKREWTWDREMVNVKELPDEVIAQRYEAIVAAIAPAINARIKAGARKIPGVRVYEEAKVDIRMRR